MSCRESFRVAYGLDQRLEYRDYGFAYDPATVASLRNDLHVGHGPDCPYDLVFHLEHSRRLCGPSICPLCESRDLALLCPDLGLDSGSARMYCQTAVHSEDADGWVSSRLGFATFHEDDPAARRRDGLCPADRHRFGDDESCDDYLQDLVSASLSAEPFRSGLACWLSKTLFGEYYFLGWRRCTRSPIVVACIARQLKRVKQVSLLRYSILREALTRTSKPLVVSPMSFDDDEIDTKWQVRLRADYSGAWSLVLRAEVFPSSFVTT